MRFEPVIALPNAWTSACGQFALHLFEGHLSLGDMEHMHDLAGRWLTKHPGKRVEMVVILPSGARMTLEERQRMVRLIKQGEPQRSASCTVILAEGLLGSVQRSILTGLVLLAPPPHPAKVFATVHEGARWLYPHARELMGARLDLDELLVAVDVNVAMFRARERDDVATVYR
jgi:hypothetical protein